MARVVFTSNLQRHVTCPECEVAATTVRAALQEVFALQPRIRDYVLDEQGELRKHVFLFMDGRRVRLADCVKPSSEIHVLQALTGG
jgi:sulfur-carrier protein